MISENSLQMQQKAACQLNHALQEFNNPGGHRSNQLEDLYKQKQEN